MLVNVLQMDGQGHDVKSVFIYHFLNPLTVDTYYIIFISKVCMAFALYLEKIADLALGN